MSFGWSAGDIIRAAELLLKVSKALSDADGARNQFQKTAALLKPIQFQLKQLGGVLEGYEGQLIADKDGYESTGVEDADVDTLQGILARLKPLVERLESAFDEGCRMGLEYPKSQNILDWPKDQLNKLKWSFVKEKNVQGLIVEIHSLTEIPPNFYREIDSKFARNQARIHSTALKKISQQIEALPQVVLEKILALNAEKNGTLLRLGPEESLPPSERNAAEAVEDNVVPTIQRACLNVDLVTYNIMSPAMTRRAATVKTDHVVNNHIKSWLGGVSPPILWLSGDDAATISAVIARAAQSGRRPCVAVSNRPSSGMSSDHSVQERLFGMMYSILYQLLQEIDGYKPLSVDQPIPSHDLDASMKSMHLTLSYIRDIILLVPRCLVVVDAWEFLDTDDDPIVGGLLNEFLGVFRSSIIKQAVGDGGRLLITSLHSSKMLHQLDKQFAATLNVKSHVNKGRQSLAIQLSNIEW